MSDTRPSTLPPRHKDEPGWEYLLRCLRHRGPVGVHTFELRGAYIGNPSERRTEVINEGHRVHVGPKEKLNGESWGVRYFLDDPPAVQQLVRETDDELFDRTIPPVDDVIAQWAEEEAA